MSMSCRDFERCWISRAPGELPPAMRDHQSSCPACAALAGRDAAADAWLRRLSAAQPVPDVDRARLAIRRALDERSAGAAPTSWRRPMLVALTGLASAAALATLLVERPARREIAAGRPVTPSVVLPVPQRGQRQELRPGPEHPAVNDRPAFRERPMNGPQTTKPVSENQAHSWAFPRDRVPAKRVVVVYGPGTHGTGTDGPRIHGLSSATAANRHRAQRRHHSAPPRLAPRNAPDEPSSADLLALNEGAPVNAQPFAQDPAPAVQTPGLPPVQERKPGSALVDDLLYLNPVRIASADDSGLRGAVRAIASEEPATDPRLQQKVFVHATLQPLGDLLGWLTRATGVSLVARLEVADERLNLWAEGRPLLDVMRDIRHLRGYYWSRSKCGDRYVYSLWQDAQSRAREEAETGRLALEQQRKFAGIIRRHVRALNASEAELKRLAQEDPYTVAQMLHPVIRGGYQLFAVLAPDQQAQLLQGQTPSRGLSFGENLNVFPLETKPGDEWTDSAEYRDSYAPLGDIVRLPTAEMTPAQRAAVTAIIRSAAQEQAREARERIAENPDPESNGSGYLEWHARALAAADVGTATASLFRWGDPASQGLSLRVDVQSGGRAWAIYSNIAQSTFWQEISNNDLRKGKLQRDPRVREVIAKYLGPQTKRVPSPADEAALRTGESPDPILDAPVSVTWKLALREGLGAMQYRLNPAEVLAALSRDLGHPLCTDLMPIELEQPRTSPAEYRWQSQPLRALLHHLFTRGRCHRDAGTIFISAPDPPHRPLNGIPPAVEQLLRARQGPYTLDDMALLARSLTPWQIVKLEQYLSHGAIDQLLEAQDLLRLYGELAPAQRAALPQGLSYAALTPAQQSLFLAFAQRQRPFVEPWRFQTGALRVTQQPAPCRKRWDNAFPLVGQAELTVRLAEDDTARFPLELVGKPERDPWRQPVADLVGRPFPGFRAVTWRHAGARADEPIRNPSLTDSRLRNKPAVILIARPYVEPYAGTAPAPASAGWARSLAEHLRDTGITVVHETLGPQAAVPAPAAPDLHLVELQDDGDANSQPFDSMGGGEHIDKSPTVFLVDGGGIVRALFEGEDALDIAAIERAARQHLGAGTASEAGLR